MHIYKYIWWIATFNVSVNYNYVRRCFTNIKNDLDLSLRFFKQMRHYHILKYVDMIILRMNLKFPNWHHSVNSEYYQKIKYREKGKGGKAGGVYEEHKFLFLSFIKFVVASFLCNSLVHFFSASFLILFSFFIFRLVYTTLNEEWMNDITITHSRPDHFLLKLIDLNRFNYTKSTTKFAMQYNSAKW